MCRSFASFILTFSSIFPIRKYFTPLKKPSGHDKSVGGTTSSAIALGFEGIKHAMYFLLEYEMSAVAQN